MSKKYDSDIPEGHAFAETRDLHPTDILLRKNGFKIHSRRKGQEPEWSLCGEVMSQTESLEMCE